jgi:hypothetical protein
MLGSSNLLKSLTRLQGSTTRELIRRLGDSIRADVWQQLGAFILAGKTQIKATTNKQIEKGRYDYCNKMNRKTEYKRNPNIPLPEI